MKINNVSSRTSIQSIVWLSVFLSLFLIGFIIIYFFASPVEIFNNFLAMDDLGLQIYAGIFVIVAPILLIWALIVEVKNRNKALKLYNYGLNLKYVNFLSGRIDFAFMDSKYDITCGYEDIEKLEMELHTIEVRNKYGEVFIMLQEIELYFTLLNGKSFSISSTPLNGMNLIYKILDYTRGIKNFSYKFSGAGVSDNIKERIDDYRIKGCRQILSTPQEDKYKFMSIIFFGIGLFFLFSFFDDIIKSIEKSDFSILIIMCPMLMLLVVSIVLDAFLIADKINDRKFGINRKSKELVGKIPCEFIIAVQFVIIAVLAYIFLKPIIFSINDKNVLNANGEFKQLWVNPPSEFNNMRKDEIYSIRKAYVKDSLFALDNYEPNERVFGTIEDYKPWWGSIICQPIGYEGDNHENIEGESQQSIQINNPNALVGLKNVYFMYDRHESDFCESEYARFIPQAIKYSEKDNLIVAEYEVSKDFLNTYVQLDNRRKRFPLQLSGLNALDFGYKYVYAFDTKNIEMFHSNNITENIGMFRDYIHVGGSCKYEGGCNNISPMQNDKMVTVKALPAEINLKLWKKQPRDKYSKADMYYRIIFKEQ